MGKSNEIVEIAYDSVRRETESARLYVIEDVEVWIPLSRIGNDTSTGEGGTVEIPEWLAFERELI